MKNLVRDHILWKSKAIWAKIINKKTYESIKKTLAREEEA